MSAAPFFVLLVDEDHRIVGFNQALENTLGTNDLCGRYCPQEVHHMEGPYPGCPLESSVQSKEPREVEIYDAPSRTWTASAIYPTSVRDERGRSLYLHMSRDITEHKRAAQRLDQSLERHIALGELLRRLQRVTTEEAAIEAFVDLTLGLSWMDVTSGAVAFLDDGEALRLVVLRDMDDDVRETCARVPRGDCICGRAALRADAGPYLVHEPLVSTRRGVHHDHGHAAFGLVHEGKTLGVVTFYLDLDARLDEHQTEFLLAAAQVTAASVAERAANRAAREAREAAALLERKVLERIIGSQEEERARIARELHDDLGQGLSALLLEIQRPDAADLPMRVVKEDLERSIRGIIDRLYRLAWDLRPAVLDDLGLYAALSRYIARTAERTGLAIDYDFIGPREERLPESVELCLYRLTQEAITNVVKHARASHASVLVFKHPETVSVLVEDDGVGFDEGIPPSQRGGGGLGLRGMRERAALLSGSLVVESAPGEGTSIRVTIPIG